MKQTLLIGFILIFFHNPVKSQVQLGFKGGYNYYFILSTDSKNSHNIASYSTNKNSFNVSCFMNFYQSKTFNPGFEIEYQWKSFRIVSNADQLASSTYSDSNFELGYLNIYLKPCLTFGSKIKISVNYGIYFSYLVNSYYSSSVRSWFMNQKLDTNYSGSAKKYFSTSDFGVLVGIGLQIPVNKKINFLIENNYTVGIINISRSDICGNLYNFLNIKFNIGLVFIM
jgi:hypothetical protein